MFIYYLARVKRFFSKVILVLCTGSTAEIMQKFVNYYGRMSWARRKRNNYTKWISLYDTLTAESVTRMQNKIASFVLKPLISIVMPTYNTSPEFLIAAIESVKKQIYPHWELCIADDASTNAKTLQILAEYATSDTRIKVKFRKENGHISAASNSALEIATGEWIALLDHDDLLSEHALFCVVDAINENPDVQLIYSDEDKITEYGERCDPYFKCDWNIDLFYSQNMFCHLGIYRAELLKKIGGFRIGFEGSQGYDLVLRCIEQIKSTQIYHIPRVLYHWRLHLVSTSVSADVKPYEHLAGERALNEHFQRINVNAKVERVGVYYRIKYGMPNILPCVSIIIPTRNRLKLIKNCITSILQKTTYDNFEIIIVDNNSDDPKTLKYFREVVVDKRIRVMRDEGSFNYSRLNNNAVRIAKGTVIALLNNDVEVISPDWLSEMVSIALQPGVGAVGAKLLYPDGTIQHAGVILGIGGVAGHAHKNLPVSESGYFGRASLISSFSAVTGACLVVKKDVYESVNGLNEDNLAVAFNDVDFCIKLLEIGCRNVWTPYAQLYHHESVSRGHHSESIEKMKQFLQEVEYMKNRWGEKFLASDPAYSPNLALDFEDFGIAWPPRVANY